MAGYTVKKEQTALGVLHRFEGPGLPRFANGAHLMQPMNEWALECRRDIGGADYEAGLIAQMLAMAYDAGHRAARQQFKAWCEGSTNRT